jgi:hypothetical protein
MNAEFRPEMEKSSGSLSASVADRLIVSEAPSLTVCGATALKAGK